MVFAWDFEDGGERSGICVDSMSYPISNLVEFSKRKLPASERMTDMLVDQNYPDIFPLCGKALKGRFDGGIVRLGVHDEEVLLRVWRRGDMLRGRIRE